jgi:enoyl-CoA hydratase
MGTLVRYQLEDSIATIAMDDGKVNALSPSMLSELGAAFDRAAADHAVVVLTGRPGVFSAGFDLTILSSGSPEARGMLRSGFELAERLLRFPTPVVLACSGHALAMASFLLLSGDYRVGADGPYKIGANEVTIGLTMPRAAVEICKQRLATPHFHRAVINAEIYTPECAVTAGFLDRVVPAADLPTEARAVAASLLKLNMAAHASTKLRAREAPLKALREAIEADDADVGMRLAR